MRNFKQFRVIVGIALIALSASALANAAMGLALEIFDFRIWSVYVIATVVLEAWIIGRSLSFDWFRSCLFSLGINCVTAFCCAGGLFAPFLHRDVIDLNPFLWTFELLAVFGLLSALVEALLWKVFYRERGSLVLRRSLLAHALGIPIALVILLLPARPYPGLEGVTNVWRYFGLIHRSNRIYEGRVRDDGSVRQFAKKEELEQRLDELGGLGVCLYKSVYRRFDTHDPRIDPLPFELNQHLEKDDEWLIRIKMVGRGWELRSDSKWHEISAEAGAPVL